MYFYFSALQLHAKGRCRKPLLVKQIRHCLFIPSESHFRRILNICYVQHHFSIFNNSLYRTEYAIAACHFKPSQLIVNSLESIIVLITYPSCQPASFRTERQYHLLFLQIGAFQLGTTANHLLIIILSQRSKR